MLWPIRLAIVPAAPFRGLYRVFLGMGCQPRHLHDATGYPLAGQQLNKVVVGFIIPRALFVLRFKLAEVPVASLELSVHAVSTTDQNRVSGRVDNAVDG